MFSTEIETIRNDASMGLFLKGRGDFEYEPQTMTESSLKLLYDIKELKLIDYQDGKAMLVVVNNGKMQIIELE